MRWFIDIIVFSQVIILLNFPNRVSARKMYLVSQRGGILVSHSGDDWKEINRGLPDDVLCERLHQDVVGNLYLSTRHAGIFKLSAGSNAWRNINSPEFFERSTYRREKRYRKISAFSVSDHNTDILMLATKHTLFLSRDGGLTWKAMPLRGLRNSKYITALAIRGQKPDVFLGTSFNGIFKSDGDMFIRSSSGLPREPYSRKLHFYEEIACNTIDSEDPGVIYVGLNFGGGIFRSADGGRSWSDLNFPVDKTYSSTVYDIKTGDGYLIASTSSGIYEFNKKTESWSLSPLQKELDGVPDNLVPVAAIVPLEQCRNASLFYKWHGKGYCGEMMSQPRTFTERRALYASIPALRKRFHELRNTIVQSNLNSIVIDVKDDFGNIYFPAANRTARQIGAIRRDIRMKGILKSLKGKGIYAIARIVVFKDMNLHQAKNNRYAIWNRKYNRPWKGDADEYWVDPHSEFVRNYNISIAKEIALLGFDEIQFDYIRFPSDGPLQQCLYRYRKDGSMYKSEVLMDFLLQARDEISLPISVDIYGFNAWYHFGNYIGQDIEEFAEAVDVVCPMVYPSHFGRFYLTGPREQRSYRLVYDSGRRAFSILGCGAVIRPYIQAFDLLSPTWGPAYLHNQMRASVDSGCSGFTFWNAQGDYQMLRKALRSR